MVEEMDSLSKNDTWSLVQKHKVVGSKWIFKRKLGVSVVEAYTFKARLVARSFSHIGDVNSNESSYTSMDKREKMLSDLPCDVVDEILSRVPTKSPIRLRSTCKRWNSLFDDHRFSEKHIVHAIQESLFILTSDLRIFTISCDLQRVDYYNVNRCEFGQKECFYEEKGKILEVLHCDGLLLVITEKFELVVWNPCLKQTKLIEKPNYGDGKRPGYAIGCDKKSCGRRYKIVVFLEGWYRQEHYSCTQYDKIEIYDFTSNSWSVVNVTIDFLLLYPIRWVSLKGNSYWVGADPNTFEGFVVRFDFSTEKFGRLSLPFLAYPSRDHFSMSVKNYRISVLHQRSGLYGIDIWMTGPVKDGQEVSWSKLMRVDEEKFGMRFRLPYFFIHDEENKLLVFCDTQRDYDHRVCVIEEERYTEAFVEEANCFSWPILQNYFPSLVHIR